MKYVFVILVLAGIAAGCNNGTDGGATSGDSAVLATPTTVTPSADTTMTVDSTKK